MKTVKAKIHVRSDYEPILPLALPDLKDAKAFADHLHLLGKHWQGAAFRLAGGIHPGKRQKTLDSNMTFTPADFWIGEGGIWFYSLV